MKDTKQLVSRERERCQHICLPALRTSDEEQ